ncbi:hypothetical protein BU24DRAFT_88659 [Aaosphaeria arxii CBS 175.79]|uniref:Uncharacterized protein n=1 Tax=Aaosphaeria arxii CBS 175.79 TaxID=1450172 RepID=A0A6A5X7Z9_9PLEO|nr:uncharacterized protein BU24DRAFT_88659 [Aaosphaeria arxii CBS 175.79]KAF2008937.1 hypothetical protein BU24DRAFT_88659 [Aaosphaeria arxii CBS 175.79]
MPPGGEKEILLLLFLFLCGFAISFFHLYLLRVTTTGVQRMVDSRGIMMILFLLRGGGRGVESGWYTCFFVGGGCSRVQGNESRVIIIKWVDIFRGYDENSKCQGWF